MALRMARGTSVTMRWVQWSQDAVVDPTTGARLDSPVPGSATFTGFVHFVTATTGIRQFREVEVGDVIVDLPPEVSVDGLDQVRFEIGGEVFVPRDVGEKLQRHWDTMEQGQKLCRTLLLRKAT